MYNPWQDRLSGCIIPAPPCPWHIHVPLLAMEAAVEPGSPGTDAAGGAGAALPRRKAVAGSAAAGSW